MKKLSILLLVVFGFSALQLFPNNVLVENISLESQVASQDIVYVEFDLSWDNSWRVVSTPDNYDASYVFVKFSVAGGPWKHATLSTNDFTAPYGCTIEVTSDSVGAFLYRSNNGSGTNDWNNIRLRWEYGQDSVPDDAYLDVRVYAIEMVYVPQGEFYLGDGSGLDACFVEGSTTQPYLVTSEDPIPLGTGADQLYSINFGFTTTTPIQQDYPKGYQAFYCMKYELSQEQFVEFLNILTRDQQETRTETTLSSMTTPKFVMTNFSAPNFRNGIYSEIPPAAPQAATFSCNLSTHVDETGDGETLAANYISWPDLAAYLDWCGLRPMTELEYEKICRGGNYPVSGEYAWGTTNIHSSSYTLSNRGLANEGITDPGTATGNACYSSTSSFLLRCGIFAASAVNAVRQETGASYYGVMEMGGNLHEMIVTSYSQSGRSYTGIHGNGSLNASGDADVDYWPGINNNNDSYSENGSYLGTFGVTGAAGGGERGGSWTETAAYLQASYRLGGAVTLNTQRREDRGGRGVRTAN